MKYILILFTLISFYAKGQTFTVTKVETAPLSEYQDAANNYLGKHLTIKFYDDVVSVKFEGSKENTFLKKTSDNIYELKDDKGHQLAKITIVTTLGVITSIEFEGNEYNAYNKLLRWVRLTAKRF